MAKTPNTINGRMNLMDIVTVAGLILGLIGVFVGMYLKGVPFTALGVPAAYLIIIVGTMGAVLIASPKERLKTVGKLLGVIFGDKKYMSKQKAIEELVHFTEIARQEGLLALEKVSDKIEDPFLQRGIAMINIGAAPEFVEDMLLEEIAATEERHNANAQIFTQAGTYAPTLGVLGAVIGLIAALTNLNDVEKLGHAISAAFIATMLGIFTGYVLWHPFANKLRQKSLIEMETKMLIIKGIIALLHGENPQLMREKLTSYLAVSERTKHE